MGEFEVYGAAGEHDQGESGFGGVEAVASSYEEPHLGVEAFDPAVRADRRMHLNAMI